MISESSCTKQPVDNGQLAGSHNDIDVSLTNIYKDGLQDKMRNSEVSKVNHSPLKTYERTTTVIARRMSDTAMVPTTIKSTDSNTSEILENHHKIQPSRLPRSPDLSKITSLRKGRAEEDLKKVTTTNKTHSKGVSRIAYPQSFQKESSHLTKCSSLDTSKCQDNQDDAKSTSVTSNDVLTQKSPPLYKTFRGQYGTINASPNNSPKFNSQGSFRTQPKCETIKSEEMEEVLSPSPQETRKQEGPCPAAVVLPRRVSPKVDNFLSKKSSSSKSKQNALLKRQNAEDLGSSSDTDTEGSGITFTINLKKKEGELKSKTTSKTRSDSLTTNGATKSTNNANVKSNDSAKVRPACTSPPTSRVILESKLSPKSSPQSPSNVPWRKANHQRDVTNDVASATENAKPGGVTSTSYIPTFSGICRTGNEVLGANSPTIYRKQPDSKALTNDQIPSPETPIVKSRSTRKLKLPAAGRVNEVTGTSPEIKGVPQVETPPAQRSVVRPLKNTAAPNVKLMIEKFNKKVTEEQSSPSLLRSPKLGVNRIRSPIGVQKSTSFTDPSPSSPPITSAESVIKSASASTIESRTRLMGSSLHSPSQTPEMPFKRTPNSSTGQPVGIASRIPRCLKSISEQESGDITKNDSTIFVKQPMTPSSEVVAQDSFNRASVWTSSNDSIRQSPTVAIRAQQIRRAKEEFLFTKIPVSSPAPCADNPSSSSSCSSPTPGWRPQSHRIPSSPLMAEPQLKRNATDVTPSECAKPKSILKVTNKEASSTAKLEPIPTETTDTTTKIMKSASAGAVDDPTTLKLSDLSSDHGSQSSVTSITQQTSQKSGIFNFKFRKAKMKQKKESLNTVKALCRQSLFVDIQPETDYVEQAKPSMMAPTTARSCPSSPELQGRPNGKTGWLAKPRILFKLK